MTATPEDRNRDELGQRLSRDAATWEPGPSDRAVAKLRSAVAELPSRSRTRWRRTAMIAACLLTFALLAWLVRRPPLPADGNVVQLPAVSLDDAIEPLERELTAVSDDATALADAVWHGVPEPLRRLVAPPK